MKTPILSLFALALLAACGSKDDKKAAASASGLTGGCPVINGTYEGKSNDETLTIKLATKQEGAVFSYRMGDEGAAFFKADGQTQRIQTDDGLADVKVTCGGNAVEFYVKPDAKEATDLKFTDIGGNQLKGEAAGQTVILTKQ